MQKRMFSLAFSLKILRHVICFDLVDVMNIFARGQQPTKFVLN